MLPYRPAAIDEELRWHAAYTGGNNEKRSCESLKRIGIETYLPVVPLVRKYKGAGIVEHEKPMLVGYIFVGVKSDREYSIACSDPNLRHMFDLAIGANTVRMVDSMAKSVFDARDSKIKSLKSYASIVRTAADRAKGLLGKSIDVKGMRRRAVEAEVNGKKILMQL